MTNKIDHFAIGTSDLATGIEQMAEVLGMTIPAGGKHVVMGTHNALMSTGNGTYMELIAIDEELPAPKRIRWFTLDAPDTKAHIAKRPRALCWVVATDDIERLVANSPVDLGEIITLSRDGRTWRLTVPQDGSLPEHGLLPAFIEWSPGPHPSQTQPDLGARLAGVTLTHPNPQALHQTLKALAIDHLATITTGPVALSFEITTPTGTVILD